MPNFLPDKVLSVQLTQTHKLDFFKVTNVLDESFPVELKDTKEWLVSIQSAKNFVGVWNDMMKERD